MTAINWLYVDETMLAMATDTQVSLGEGPLCGAACNFCTKVLPLPHLHAVLCGTGSLQLLMDWFCFVQLNAIGRDIGTLLDAAPKRLPELVRARQLPPDVLTTLYHVGFDAQGRLRTFAHRSQDGFVTEELDAGFMMKPSVPGAAALQERFLTLVGEGAPLPTAFVNLIARQREADKLEDPAEHVGIGGEIHFLTLSPNIQSIWSCYRFDNFDEEFAKVLTWAASYAPDRGPSFDVR